MENNILIPESLYIKLWEYFDGKSDADGSSEGFTANEEMKLLIELEECNNHMDNIQTELVRWPDEVRLEMVEHSKLYDEPRIYQYGYYDGYTLQNEKIIKAIEMLHKASAVQHKDALINNIIIHLLNSEQNVQVSDTTKMSEE